MWFKIQEKLEASANQQVYAGKVGESDHESFFSVHIDFSQCLINT